MPKTKTVSSRRRTERSYEEFMAEHASERTALDFLFEPDKRGPRTLAEAAKGPLPPTLPPVMAELRNHAFFRLLAAAARENCREAFDIYLYLWLHRMGIRPPEGVFVGPAGVPGRPRDRRTALIYDKWIEMGQPSLGRRTLAHAVYGVQFSRSSSVDRKKMVDRCRRAVQRRQEQLGPNSV